METHLSGAHIRLRLAVLMGRPVAEVRTDDLRMVLGVLNGALMACPHCGDLGAIGRTCEDCGCACYGVQAEVD